MKRIVAIVLSAAMLFSLLFVSVFAESQVHIDFSLPVVGDDMTKSGTISAGEGIICNIQSVYTGDIVDTILNETNSDALLGYASANNFPEEPYRNQKYLIIFSLYSESIPLSDETVISSTASVEESGVLLASAPKLIFAYLLFTPTENTSQENENNTGSGDDTNTENGSASTTAITEDHEVKVTYDDSVFTRTIVSVDFTWGAMEFTYTPSTEGLWNPNTHEYETPTEDLWTSTTNNVTITNHSNTALKAVFNYHPAVGFSEITGTFIDDENADCTNREITLESAVGKTVTDAPSATAYLILDGSLAKDVADKTVSGTVTITIQ